MVNRFKRHTPFSWGLYILAIICFTILPMRSSAQITIKEKLQLGNQLSTKQKSTNQQPSLFSFWGPPQMIASKSGKLKIYLNELERYHDAIPDSAALVIHILNKEKDLKKRIALKQHLDTVLVSQGTYGCPGDWYFYGSGPFRYTRTTGNPTGQDGMVNNLHGQRKEGERWVSYSDQNKNYAGRRRLSISWRPPEITNNYRRPDPTIRRSFMEFNFSIPPQVKVKNATLTIEQGSLLSETDPNYLEPDKYIYLYKVSDAWSSSSLTWNNQPGIYGDPIKIKKSSRHNINDVYLWFDINVAPFVKNWIANPNGNYGVRFSLKGGDGSDALSFYSGNGPEYTQPVLSIDFTNPKWSRKNSVITVGNVSKGDTVRFTYDNLGGPQDYSNVIGPINHYYYQFRGIEDAVDTSKVKQGYALSFLNTQKSNLCRSSWLPTEFMGAFAFVAGAAGDKIMLGETKYYAAVREDPGDPSSDIKIKRVEAGSSASPAVPDGLVAGAFGDHPIEVLSGGKSGVYWSRKWATINDDGTVKQGDLPSGMIRVIGRYWSADKDYKVKLQATSGGSSASLKISVVKPDRLGNDTDEKTYTDALQKNYDLDSLAIHYGGKYGIPPQFLKGMISQESSGKAAYRYEENTDYKYEMNDRTNYPDVRRRMENNFYWIADKNDEGNPPIPANHIVFENQGYGGSYPGFVGTMFDVFKKKREDEIENRFEIQQQLKNYKDVVERELKDQAVPNDSIQIKADKIANSQLNEWIKNEYRGGLSSIAKQTRIVASYGPLQLMYLYGFYENTYPENRVYLPETMNEDVNVGIKYAIKFFIYRKFNQSYSDTDAKFSQNNNWPHGFEESLRRGANVYNGNNGSSTGKGYGDKIWVWARKYELEN